jgi:hypothetical protein
LRFEVRSSRFEVRGGYGLRVTGCGFQSCIPFVLVPESNKFLELSGLKVREFDGLKVGARRDAKSAELTGLRFEDRRDRSFWFRVAD